MAMPNPSEIWQKANLIYFYYALPFIPKICKNFDLRQSRNPKIADQLFFGKLQLDLTSQIVFTINYWQNVRSS